MKTTLEDRLFNMVRTMEEDKERWRGHWSDLRDFLLPRHGRNLGGKSSEETNNGEKKHTRIYDGSHLRAMNDLAGGMQSGLTSPSRPWFKLSTGDTDLDDDPEVAQWLHSTEGKMYSTLHTSNMYTVFHQCYKELGVFGTAPISIEEDPVAIIRGRCFTIGEYSLSIAEDGRVDTFQRTAHLTARQMIGKFGEDEVAPLVRQAAERGDEKTRFCVEHLIMDADDELKSRMDMKKPFASVWLYAGDASKAKRKDEYRILSVSGFDSFPIMAPRWEVVADNTYGESAGMDILPDVKSIQVESKTLLVMIEKASNPPVVAPGDLRGTQINSMPGGVTFSDALVNGGQGGLRPLYEVRPDISALTERINHQLLSVREGMFSDLFRMLQMSGSSRMTATEVAERQQEKLLLLGPVIERVHSELLGPALDRIYDILNRRGLIDPPPPELEGRELRVIYVSILAQAQRMVGVANTEQFLSFVGNLAAVDPTVMDNVNLDEAVRDYGSRLGVSPRIIRPKEQVDAAREARAPQEQSAQAIPAMQAGAEAAKLLSQADLGGNNALTALMGGAPQ